MELLEFLFQIVSIVFNIVNPFILLFLILCGISAITKKSTGTNK